MNVGELLRLPPGEPLCAPARSTAVVSDGTHEASGIHALFEAQVARSPDAPALVFGDQVLTYAELNRQANRWAHRLIELGAGSETRVGLCVERSPNMVVGLLAILKAGSAYLPLDPAYPAARLQMIVEDSRPSVLLTQRSLRDRLPRHEAVALLLDGDDEALAQCSTANPGTRAAVGNLAYVIYTSGSTGRPKGVAIEHRSVVTFIRWALSVFTADELSGVLASTSICFDLSVFELFVPLSAGGRVILIENALKLADLPRTADVRLINTVPSVMAALLPLDAVPDSVVTVNLAGELLPTELVNAIYRKTNVKRVYDLYGPTEDTTYSTYTLRLPDVRATIGRPIDETAAYILDDNLQPVPIGTAGELYLTGMGLARGYLNRPGLTAERFTADPFATRPGGRMYRTGDMAVWRDDGTIECQGRADHQVKLRGFRIELGDIESALRAHDRVQDAAVLVQGQGEQRHLVGYVVARPVEAAQSQPSVVSDWQEIYDSTYKQNPMSLGDFNIAGWNSSYTGEPIPAEEMGIWVDETTARIRALQPRRVLEIGCGTGLLLTRLAGACQSYLGVDFSAQVLAQLKGYLTTRQDLGHVELRQGMAHELSFRPDDSVDLVIVNSVAQHFPDVDYLLDVVAEAIRVTQPGGHVFLGDLRSLPLLEAFHASVQMQRASATLPLEHLRQRVDQALRNEEQLVVDPALFLEFGRRSAKVGRVETTPKGGTYDNEVSRFRYDVTLTLGEKQSVAEPQRWLTWDAHGDWLGSIEQALRLDPQLSVGLRGFRDRRAAPFVEAVRLLHEPTADLTDVTRLKGASSTVPGEDPEVLTQLARRLGTPICWQGFDARGVYDVVINPQWQLPPVAADWSRSQYRRFGNSPSRHLADAQLAGSLREALQQVLPEYMVPAAFVVLDRFPLTPNGKLDRKALPLPDVSRSDSVESYVAPRNPVEERLAAIWAEVLGRDQVGINDNFFDLGGHSLLAIRLFSQIKAAFPVELPTRALFTAPTVAGLARQLQSLTDDSDNALIVPIQPNGSRAPLFLMPSVTGELLFWQRIVRYLNPDQPLFGLRPPTGQFDDSASSGLEQLAAHFVDELVAFRPQGSFQIAGYSFGGYLAFEVARQLHERGREVSFTGIINSHAIGRKSSLTRLLQNLQPFFWNLYYWLLDDLLRSGRRSLLNRFVASLKTAVTSPFTRSRRKREPVDVTQFAKGLWTAEHQAIAQRYFGNIRRYVPRFYPGVVTLFRTRAQPPWSFAQWGLDLGWSEVAQQVEVNVVARCKHHQVVHEPHIRELAANLELKLQAVDGRTPDQAR